MCDFQATLIAWLDRELPEHQAAEVERHVQACEECRAERENYEQVSRTIDVYCDAVMAAKTHRTLRWVPAISGALLAIAASALFLTPERHRIEPRSVVTPDATAVP